MNPLPRILRTLKTMPPLPNVAQRVMQIVQDPNHEVEPLVAIVRTDPALVARILRFCNSARYGLDAEVTSIPDAVTYLGTRNLVQLVLVTCSASMFAKVPTTSYADPAALWRHSYACAVASQALAAQLHEVSRETAFTAGILHNVGKIALGQACDADLAMRAQQSLAEDPSLDHCTLERRMFGIDHAAAAGVVADCWRLPEALAQAIRSHHDDVVLGAASALPAIVHVADQIALQQGIGNPFPTAMLSCSASAKTRLGLTDDAIETVASHVASELLEAADLLNLAVVANR